LLQSEGSVKVLTYSTKDKNSLKFLKEQLESSVNSEGVPKEIDYNAFPYMHEGRRYVLCDNCKEFVDLSAGCFCSYFLYQFSGPNKCRKVFMIRKFHRLLYFCSLDCQSTYEDTTDIYTIPTLIVAIENGGGNVGEVTYQEGLELAQKYHCSFFEVNTVTGNTIIIAK
jgi:hypothetical protein